LFLFKFILNLLLEIENFIWGLGIGDWGLGIGDWGLGPIPNPQSPIPNPQSPLINHFKFLIKYRIISIIIIKLKIFKKIT